MTSGFKPNWFLYFTLSLSLNGWALEEGSPSQRELRWHDSTELGKQVREQRLLADAKKNDEAAANDTRRAPIADSSLSERLDAPATDLAKPSLQVYVLVYNYAQVSTERRAKAEKRAGLIFREVGIELAWAENGSGSTSLDEIDLILRILPQPRTTLANQKALGEALPCGQSREGCLASVFYSRIQEIPRREISSAEALGHAMAHELGHLLLGSDSHSARGLMRDKWEPSDLRRAAKGDLLFTHEQSRLLRRNVLARAKAKRLSERGKQTPKSSASAC